MILTQSTPFTSLQIKQLGEEYEIYIKVVIDLSKKICSAGANMHSDSQAQLLSSDSDIANIWGGGINLETKDIDVTSFINDKPEQHNDDVDIQDEVIKQAFIQEVMYFFSNLYEK